MFFFFNDTATTEIYTLSLHDALPISFTGDGAYDRDDVYAAVAARHPDAGVVVPPRSSAVPGEAAETAPTDRKSTRLNSSHANISYAVFCLKKNKNADFFFPLPHPVVS